jgi:hypothetical protein
LNLNRSRGWALTARRLPAHRPLPARILGTPTRFEVATMVHRRGRKRPGELPPVADSLHIGPAAAHGAALSQTERSTGSQRLRESERRGGADRRTRTLRSLFMGSFNPRRRGPRRAHEQSIAATDWHQPQWLAVALLILLLSIADALLTLALLQHHGVLEENPLMAALVKGNSGSFAAVKIGLTACGVVLLTALARVRAFGRVPVSALLCAVLVAYVGLVGYEVWLLQSIPGQ